MVYHETPSNNKKSINFKSLIKLQVFFLFLLCFKNLLCLSVADIIYLQAQ